MAENALQTMYRKEMIRGFEKHEALVRKTVTTEFMSSGAEATFLVADSGGASAVTRADNGDIPTRNDNLNQPVATLVEWHDVPEVTRFNIFRDQGERRKILQETSMGVINRKMDTDINTALATATTTWGSAAVATMALINAARATLDQNYAGEGEVWAQITPGFYAAISALDQFTSADYIQDKIFAGVSRSKAFDWNGVKWIVNPALAGAGTSSATCFMYNKAAIGHAADSQNMQTVIGYDDKNDKSWCRCSVFMGSVLLQNAGVIKMLHNDSTFIL